MGKELTHYGVKGMKWGVRKARTGDLHRKASFQEMIAKGEGTKLQKTVATLNTPFRKLLVKDGVRQHADDLAKNFRGQERRLATGKAKASDVLKAYGTVSISSLALAAHKKSDHRLGS